MKLTIHARREMRRLRSDGWVLRMLALRFGVTIARASQVCRGVR